MNSANSRRISASGPAVAILLASVVLLLLLPPLPISSQEPAEGGNWVYPAYDIHNTNFNPQTVINRENAHLLQVRWTYQIPRNPYQLPNVAPALGVKTTPLVVNGIVYIATPYNRVIALLADEGRPLWDFQVDMATFPDKAWWSSAFDQHNLFYDEGVIYMMASDCTAYALDAFTGQEIFEIPDTCSDIPGNRGRYFGENAPVVFRDKLILRPSTAAAGGRGVLLAYDLDTLEKVWEFFPVPPSGGEPGFASRVCQTPCRGNVQPVEGDWGDTRFIGGGSPWTLLAMDEEAGLIYFGTGDPSHLYDASLRPGPNLFANAII
ncbi:MAG: PQQ-binding-like beta-propeller repeat protein, partial [Candidatus Geothermarchaeales archaeon]